MSTTEETVEKKPSASKKGFSIAAVVVGLVLLGLGMFSIFDSEELNNSMVEVGSSQVVQNIVVHYPDAADYASKAADVVDAAVCARTADPDSLAELIYQAAADYQSPGIKSLVVSIIRQINSAYITSDTETIYLNKLTHLAKGIREGIATAIYKEEACKAE